MKSTGNSINVNDGSEAAPFWSGKRTTQGIQAVTANVAEMHRAMSAGNQTASSSAAATEARMAGMAERGVDTETMPAQTSPPEEPPSDEFVGPGTPGFTGANSKVPSSDMTDGQQFTIPGDKTY